MGHRVLVCDDAIFMRTMISDILSGAGGAIVAGVATVGEGDGTVIVLDLEVLIRQVLLS